MRTPLSDIVLALQSGVSVNAEERFATHDEIGVLKVSAVTGGDFKPEENKVVTSANQIQRLSCSPKSGDILMTRANGSKDLVGCSVLVRNDHPNLYLPDKLWRIVLRDPARDLSQWLFQVLNCDFVREMVINAASGSSGMRNISKAAFLNIRIDRPTFSEQQAIVTLLSNWDRGIRQLTDLISVKLRFKQGLMQQLLTGKLRFPEFGNEWLAARLSDATEECNERNRGRMGLESVMAVTKADGIVPMRERTIGASIDRYLVVQKNCFAYNPMRINIGSIARWHGDKDILVSPDYVVFRCKEESKDFPGLDSDFLDHFRRSKLWEKFVMATGNGSVRIRIYYSELSRLKLNLPSLAEQTKIAKLLNAIDREIELLRKQLDLLKLQKRGLMQKLLTGQVRVKLPKGAK